VPARAEAEPLRIPLHIDYVMLDAAMAHQLYTSGGRAELWNGGDNCQYLYAENPRIKQGRGAIEIDSDGTLNLGLAVAGKCLSPLAWSGVMAASSNPYINGFALKFRVTNIDLYEHDGGKSLLVGRGFDLIKSGFIPKLETFSYDLSPAIGQLRELARLAVAPEAQARLAAVLDTLTLEPGVAIEADGVRLVMDVEAPPEPAVPASPAPLNPAQAAALNATLDSWDAFLVFAIKQIGATAPDPKLRAQLFDVLIDSRQRLVTALRQPPDESGPDPIRILFLDEWTRLRAIVETAAERGKLGSRALEFLSFISAGDALFALDQAAPALGMRISSDDFRRLAHIMAPRISADPLMYSFDEDAALQNMLGVTPPLETSGPFDYPEKPVPSPSPSPSPSPLAGSAGAAAPSASISPGISPAPTPAPSPAPGGQVSMLSAIADYAGPAAACAAERYPLEQAQADLGEKRGREKRGGDSEERVRGSHDRKGGEDAARIDALGQRLRRAVVDSKNAGKYRDDLNQLLLLSARHELESDPPEAPLRQAYPVLIKAVAWQESCWRQFIVRHEKITYLESSTGDIGLMQINKYVWRGLYSLNRLKWDIVYNAGAGSEILLLTMRGAAAHNPAEMGKPADLARSAYAAYNGGPGAYGRWRARHEAAAARGIDEAFWLKYRAMTEEQSFDIVRCAIEWDRAHGQ
jgi:hypothetical protein